LTRWKEFSPDGRDINRKTKQYTYTVGSQVLSNLKDKPPGKSPQALIRDEKLPSALSADATAAAGMYDDDDEEEFFSARAWTQAELREKAQKSIQRRRGKPRKGNIHTSIEQAHQVDIGPVASASGAAILADPSSADGIYDEPMDRGRDMEEENETLYSGDLEEEEHGPTDEEINEIFLKRYNMSRERLQEIAGQMGLKLVNLCYLKHQFDAYDPDGTGCIDVKELRSFMEQLDERLTDEQLYQAYADLDSGGTGEIEFFEFVEWLTSEDSSFDQS